MGSALISTGKVYPSQKKVNNFFINNESPADDPSSANNQSLHFFLLWVWRATVGPYGCSQGLLYGKAMQQCIGFGTPRHPDVFRLNLLISGKLLSAAMMNNLAVVKNVGIVAHP